MTVTGYFYGYDGAGNIRPLSWATAWVFDVDYVYNPGADAYLPTPKGVVAVLLNDIGYLSAGPFCNRDGTSSQNRKDIVIMVAPFSSAAEVTRFWMFVLQPWQFTRYIYSAWTPQYDNVADGALDVGRWIVPANTRLDDAFRVYSVWSGILAGWDLISNKLSPSYSVIPQAEVHYLAPICYGDPTDPYKTCPGEPFPHYMVYGSKCGWTHTSGDPPLASDCAAHWADFSWQIHIDSRASGRNPFVVNHLYAHYVMQRLFNGAYPSNGATPDASSRFAGDFDENQQCDPKSGSVTSYELYCDRRFSIFEGDLDGTYEHQIAWVEGWADFFALRATSGTSIIQFQRSPGDPNCANCLWTLKLEATSSKWGAKVEWNTIGSLNDLYDAGTDHLDTISMATNDIWRVFQSKFSATLFDYWTQFKSTFSSDVNKIQGSKLAIFNNNVDLAADLRLTQNAAISNTPAIASEGSSYHVVWVDARDGNNEIYYKKVDSNWNILVGDTRLSSNSASSVSPAIAVGPSGRVEVVWSDNRDGNFEVYRRTYTPSSGWGAETRLTFTTADSKDPRVTFDASGSVHDVWREVTRTSSSETETVQYSKNGGAAATLFSFAGTAYPNNAHSDRVLSPGIVSGGTNYLHVVWSRGPAYPVEGGISYLYYRRWNGNSWDATVTIGTDQDVARRIRIDAGGPTVVAVWEQWQDGFDISYRTSSNYGASFASEVVITKAGYQFAPDVAVNPANGDWYLTYSDNAPGQYEIVAWTHVPGALWPLPITDLAFGISDAGGDSLYPRVVYSTASSMFSVAWQDMRDGNWEIYWMAVNIWQVIAN